MNGEDTPELIIITGVKASGAEASNPPENVLDNNDETRWSSEGLGQWINLELGENGKIQEVHHIITKWFKGAERTSEFEITGRRISQVRTLISRTKTTGETVKSELPEPTLLNSITITGFGNSQNDWVSITEIEVWGKKLDKEPPPPCPEGEFYDEDLERCSSELDEFGIRKIYPTNMDSERPRPWFLGIPEGDWKTRATNWVGVGSDDPQGFLQLRVTKADGQIRFRVNGTSDSPSAIETDQRILRSRGFMGNEMDWKNVEMTMYIRVNKVSPGREEDLGNGGRHFELEARGGRHGGDRPPCEGTALHTNLYVTGRVKLEKELSHTKGYTDNDPNIENVTENLMHRWIGMKGIFFNKSNGDVKSELWLDKNGDNDWGEIPVLEKEDSGGWFIKRDRDRNPNGDNECDGEKDEKISWGGPIVTFRWDNLTDVDIKFASVREIIPP